MNQIYIRNPKNPGGEDPKSFAFDLVYGPEIVQRRIYDEVAFPLVEAVLQGFNGTIFAYGQTGCGKTYTMVGDKTDEVKKGITPNALTQIFTFIDADKTGTRYLVRCSYIEIYNEDIFDLLGNDVEAKLALKENKDKGVYIKDLTTTIVKKFKEIDDLLTVGFSNRHKAETSMNKESSRSHCIFTIYIESAESKLVILI